MKKRVAALRRADSIAASDAGPGSEGRIPCADWRVILSLFLMMIPISALGQCTDPLNPEQVLERMRQNVPLTEAQCDAIRPPVLKLCQSIGDVRRQFSGKEMANAVAVRKDIDAKTLAFQDTISGHLDATQRALMKKMLAEWTLEIIRAATGGSLPEQTVKESGDFRVSLSITPPRFEDSLDNPMTQLALIEPESTSPPAGTDTKPKRGELAIAPYPLVSPAIGNGLVLIAAYMRPLSEEDKISPPSIFGLGGMFTSSKSWAAGYGQKLFLKEDRFRILGALGIAQINYDFSVSGHEAGSKSYDIPIQQKGFGFVAGGEVRTHERWYLGMQYSFIKTKTGIDLNDLIPDLPIDEKTFSLNIKIAGLKALIERDSRDSQFYPRRGSALIVSGDFNEEAFGGDFNYQKYQISYRSFVSLGRRQIIAYTASACAVEGKVPFFGVCMLGSSSDLRGYVMGKHQDRRMLTAQAEYRLELPWRFGAVGFAGAGEVADRWANFSAGNLLPGGGLGLRFLLAKSNHVNLRLDYAWGKGGQTWYVGLGEAF